MDIIENITKSSCRYLLQRYLGEYLKEKLTKDRLSVNLLQGTGTVTDLELDVKALNTLAEQQNLPIEFIEGYIKRISVNMSYKSILSEPSDAQVEGLNITVQPKHRSDNVAKSMFESMWSCMSMTSSRQMAEEFLQKEPERESVQNFANFVELCASSIEAVLSRIKITFIKTVIKCEYVPQDSSSGVAIQITVDSLEFTDSTENEPNSPVSGPIQQEEKVAERTHTTKRILLDGIKFSTYEFSTHSRTSSTPIPTESQDNPAPSVSQEPDNEQSYRSANDSGEEFLEADNASAPSPTFNLHTSQETFRKCILFAKLSGKQEIRLRLKRQEEFSGPKVCIELTLGSLFTFLSPRQMHSLIELSEGFANPFNEDLGELSNEKCVHKLMTNSDFKRVEADLNAQLQPLSQLQGTGLHNILGWSRAPLGEDSDDEFEAQTLPANDMAESILSTASSMESIASSASSQTTSSRSSKHQTNRARRRGGTEIPTEVWQLDLRLSSVAVVLLMEDLLTLSTGIELLAPASVQHAAQTAQNFFDSLNPFTLGGYGSKDFDNAATVFENACSLSHIRLLAAPVQLESTQKHTAHTVATYGHCTAAKLQILECLMPEPDVNSSNNTESRVQRIELLEFPPKSQKNIHLETTPNFTFTFKQSVRSIRYFQGRKTASKTELRFHLDRCQSEFDITIMDRISALLYPEPIFARSHETGAHVSPSYGKCTDSSTVEKKFECEIVSPECLVKIRFPIPDMRPVHDMQRCPWWRRNVRPDFMSLKLEDASFSFAVYARQPATRIELSAQAVHISYTMKDSITAIPIGKSSSSNQGSPADNPKYPRLVVQIYPQQSLNGELDESSGGDSEPLSCFDAFTPSKVPGPFCSKRIVHESDTPHNKQQEEVNDDKEEIVMPGNKEEIREFMDFATRSARIQLDISFPEVTIQLASKHIFETLYNRISTDLLLWQPAAPRPHSGGYDSRFLGGDLRDSIHPAFSMCKSGIQYESDDSGDSDDDNYFPYTSGDTDQNLRSQVSPKLQGQSHLALTLSIEQGLLHMFTPVRDSGGNVIPGHQGEVLLYLSDTTIFSVNGFRGNGDLGYVCIEATSANLYHCGIVPTPSGSPPLKDVGSAPPRHLYPTIYATEEGIKIARPDADSHSMLTVAIRINAQDETENMKVIRVACAIYDATLKVNVSRVEHTWLTQLQDMIDVLDYPVAGYTPSPVLTELHVHLWSNSVDYRPINIPIRALLTIGNFSISSNLLSQNRTNTLRVIAEDCSLLLSKSKSKKLKLSEYVCVLDLGLFELSLRYTDKPRGNNPQTDLRASNDMLHIRTCSDSARALTELIQYIAVDGDIPDVNLPTQGDSRRTSGDTSETDTLLNVQSPLQICELSKSQHQRVIEDLNEAMQESMPVAVDADDESVLMAGQVRELFFFPDESVPSTSQDNTPLPQVVTDLGDTTVKPAIPVARSSDTDDEYCIIDDEAKNIVLGTDPGKTKLRLLTKSPYVAMKNAFAAPGGPPDKLKTPKHFPKPITRYTLCEMNVIWHMYGGEDFQTNTENTKEKKKTVNFADKKIEHHDVTEVSNSTVLYDKSDPNTVKFSTPKKVVTNTNWKTKGGVGRRQDILMELQLNKVRFRHEIYPDTTHQASRQVLLIGEVEIRDRLHSSQFNKFLYQYTSEKRPKRTNMPMVEIKQAMLRPDPRLKREESCLKVSLLPLRLNIDQDSLLFLMCFFKELSGEPADLEDSLSTASVPIQPTVSRHNTPTHQPPIMTVNSTVSIDDSSMDDSITDPQEAQRLVSENLLILLEDDLLTKPEDIASRPATDVPTDKPPVYFRDVKFEPAVAILIDYHGKRVDMSGPGGALAGLLLGLGQLNCSEITLRKLRHRYGILGFEKLVSYALREWLTDIRKNHLSRFLGGVGPMYAVVQLFSGIRDLFWLPIEQYQKDGRIVHGLQRGANSFTTSTAMAAIELTSRIIHLIQATAETAYDMVSPGPSVKRRFHGKKGKRRRYNQPQDLREGVSNAYTLVKEGIEETAQTLLRTASIEHEQKGYSGAVGGILRQIPSTVVKPIILATEATNNVLGGMVCELVPDVRREASQKWRNNDL